MARESERASPPTITVRNDDGNRPARRSSPTTDGVLASMVAPDPISATANAVGTTRTVPPTISGPSTSRMNGSKLNETLVVVTASSSGLRVDRIQSATLVRLRCATCTALGRPEEPEVNRM